MSVKHKNVYKTLDKVIKGQYNVLSRRNEGGGNMSEASITKEQEEKRLEKFQEIAENWDKFPERVQGKIDGIISMAASAFLKDKKAG